MGLGRIGGDRVTGPSDDVQRSKISKSSDADKLSSLPVRKELESKPTEITPEVRGAIDGFKQALSDESGRLPEQSLPFASLSPDIVPSAKKVAESIDKSGQKPSIADLSIASLSLSILNKNRKINE